MNKYLVITCIAIVLCLSQVCCGKDKPKKKKALVDMTDHEIEKIYEQWEEGEEKLPDDELPPYMRKQQGLNLNVEDLKGKSVDQLKALNKKGKALMIFVTVSGNPTKEETERITALWQNSLFNSNIEMQRYPMDDNRVIFMVSDGALSWEIKEFLVKQERCLEVTIDSETFPGAGADKEKEQKKNKKEL